MAKQTIGVGTIANDGTGDTLRATFQKTNSNFDELYATDYSGVYAPIANGVTNGDSHDHSGGDAPEGVEFLKAGS